MGAYDEALAKCLETGDSSDLNRLAQLSIMGPKGMRKSISRRKGVNPKEGENEYGDTTFADPVNKKYPIDTKEHVLAAWNYIQHPDDAAKYDGKDLKTIKDRIVAAYKKLVNPDGPPELRKKED